MKFRIWITTLIALCALGMGTKGVAGPCCKPAGNFGCNSVGSGTCTFFGGTYYTNCCDVSDQGSTCLSRCLSYAPPDYESDGETDLAQQLRKSNDRVAKERAVFEVEQVTKQPSDAK